MLSGQVRWAAGGHSATVTTWEKNQTAAMFNEVSGELLSVRKHLF